MSTSRFQTSAEALQHTCCFRMAIIDTSKKITEEQLVAEFTDPKLAIAVVDLLNARAEESNEALS